MRCAPVLFPEFLRSGISGAKSSTACAMCMGGSLFNDGRLILCWLFGSSAGIWVQPQSVVDNSGNRKMEWDIGLLLYGQGCRCLLNNLPLSILLIIGIVLLLKPSRDRWFLKWCFPKTETSIRVPKPRVAKPKSEKDCPRCREGGHFHQLAHTHCSLGVRRKAGWQEKDSQHAELLLFQSRLRIL